MTSLDRMPRPHIDPNHLSQAAQLYDFLDYRRPRPTFVAAAVAVPRASPASPPASLAVVAVAVSAPSVSGGPVGRQGAPACRPYAFLRTWRTRGDIMRPEARTPLPNRRRPVPAARPSAVLGVRGSLWPPESARTPPTTGRKPPF